MQPQLNGFNSNDNQSNWWNLEIRLNNVYKSSNFRDTLYVVKGGTIDNGNYTWAQGRGQRLPVPKYFFMALLRKKNSLKTNGGFDAIGFWMEHISNTDKNLKNYVVTIDELERNTGIDFFCNLTDEIENAVEGKVDLSVWKLN
jgi:endonuclease G